MSAARSVVLLQEGVNMDNILSKEKFISTINGLKKYDNFENELNDLIRKYGEGYVILSDVSFLLIDTLEKMYEDDNGRISYFCYELEFGRKYEPGMIKESNGDEIKLQTPEDLYNLLINELKLKYGGE